MLRASTFPGFFDIQAYLTYDLSREWQMGIIGNYNSSVYQLIPESRETAQGLIDFTLQLSTVYQGRQSDDFVNGMGGVSFTFIPQRASNPLFLKFLASGYRSREREQFDIQGAYRLSQIETGLGDDAGEEILLLGTGIQHEYTRNFLTATILNFQHKGGVELQRDSEKYDEATHFLQWGLKVQSEDIFDKLNEWERLDSAGYSLPYNPDAVLLQGVLKSRNEIQSVRFNAFFPG